jgi:SAM-dependent methyltransferase
MSGPTRGDGLLEGFLSKKRSDLARHKLTGSAVTSILDIGCGSDPLFLKSTSVDERFGVDRLVPDTASDGPVRIAIADVGALPVLPFKDESFDAVTMLAVLEHLPPDSVPKLLDDIYRVLKNKGVFVLTTPPPRTNHLLKLFAKVRIVSPEEIDEHERAYTIRDIKGLFARSKFEDRHAESGTFELGMNLWARATKRGEP